MITNRLITDEDYPILEQSLELDQYHVGTLPSFFYEEGTLCSVYEDEDGIVCFVRGKPVLYGNIGIIQLDIQYRKNNDAKRNMRTMLDGFPKLEEKAKQNGFAGFMFASTSPLLRKFCIKRLGFSELNDEFLVKVLQEK